MAFTSLAPLLMMIPDIKGLFLGYAFCFLCKLRGGEGEREVWMREE